MARTTIGAGVLILRADGEVNFQRSLRAASHRVGALQNDLLRLNSIQDIYGRSIQSTGKRLNVINALYKRQQEQLSLLKKEKQEIDDLENENERNRRTSGWEKSYSAVRREVELTKKAWYETRLELARSKSDLFQYGQKLKSIGNDVQDIGKKFTKVGVVLSAAVTLPLVGFGKSAVSAAKDYEYALANVQKVANLTTKQTKDLGQGFMELSSKVPMSTQELLKIAEAGGRMYKTVPELKEYTRVMSELGNTTDLSLEEGAERLTKFMNIMGTGLNHFRNIGSTVVELGNNFVTSESSIVQMATRIASAGRMAGMSEAQILGLSNAMVSLDIRANRGGTAISKLLTMISKAVLDGTEDVQKFADAAGMSAEKFSQAWKSNPMNALQSLFEGLNRVRESGGNVYKVMEDLGVKEIRMSDVVRLLSIDHEDLARSVSMANNAWEENTSLAHEAAQRYATNAAQLDVQRNRFENLKVAIGEKLLPIVVNFLDSVNDTIGSFNKLSDGTQSFIVKLGILAAAIGPMTTILGGLTTGAGKAISAVGNIVTAFADAGIKANVAGEFFKKFGTQVDDTGGKISLSSRLLTGLVTKFGLLGSVGIVGGIAAVAAVVGMLAHDMTMVSEEVKKAEEANKRFRESMNGMSSESAVASREAGLLADRVLALANNSNRSSGQTELLKMHIARLNELVPGLDLAFDSTSNSINKSEYSMKMFIERAGKMAMVKAQMDVLADSMKDLAKIDLDIAVKEEEIKRLEAVLAKAPKLSDPLASIALEDQKAVKDIFDKYNDGRFFKVGGTFSAAKTILKDRRKDIEELTRQQSELEQNTKRLEETITTSSTNIENQFRRGEGTLASVTGEIINTADLAKNKVVSSANETTEGVGLAMNQLTEEQEKMLSDMKSKFENSLPGIADAIAAPLKNANSETKMSLADLEENLRSNIESIRTWRDNLIYIAEEAGVGVADALLDLGPAGRDIVAELVGQLKASTDANFPEIIGLLKEYAGLGSDSFEEWTIDLPRDVQRSMELAKGEIEGSDVASATREVGEKAKDSYQKEIDQIPENTQDTLNRLSELTGVNPDTFAEMFKQVGVVITEALQTEFSKAEQYATDFPGKLASAIEANKQTLVSYIFDLMLSMSKDVQESNEMYLAGKSIATRLGDGLRDHSALITGQINSVLTDISKSITVSAAPLSSTGHGLMSSLAQGLIAGKGNVVLEAKTVAKAIVDEIKNNSPKMSPLGNEYARNFSNGIRSQESMVNASASRVSNATIRGFDRYRSSAYSIGVNFGRGFGLGVGSQYQFVYKKAYGMARAAVNAARSATRTHSPSEVAREIGQNFSIGMGLGVNDKSAYVAQKAREMSEKMIHSLYGGQQSRLARVTPSNADGGKGVVNNVTITVNNEISNEETADMAIRKFDRYLGELGLTQERSRGRVHV